MSGTFQQAPLSPMVPGYRLGLVLRCAALAAVVFAIFALAMFVALDVELAGSYAQVMGAVDEAAGRLAGFILPGAALCIALVGLGCAFFGIRASHKVAGPAYRLSADLRRMASGDYSFEVSTRRKDHLKDIAEELERARTDMRGRLLKAKQCCRQIERALRQEAPPWDDIHRDLKFLEDALSDAGSRQEVHSQ